MQGHSRVLAIAAVLPALALGLTACSAKSTPPGPSTTASPGGSSGTGGTTSANCTQKSAAAHSTTITIQNFTFLQSPDTVSPGATITVDNSTACTPATHTLTATSPSGAFDTGDITPGSSKTFKAPTKPGTYHYICSIHPYMTGTLIVS